MRQVIIRRNWVLLHYLTLRRPRSSGRVILWTGMVQYSQEHGRPVCNPLSRPFPTEPDQLRNR
jgi:hypothetical protein